MFHDLVAVKLACQRSCLKFSWHPCGVGKNSPIVRCRYPRDRVVTNQAATKERINKLAGFCGYSRPDQNMVVFL